jgi:hypothetical protein
MPHTEFTYPGSGTIPGIEASLPGGHVRGTPSAVTHRDTQAVAVLNPEDFSAYMGAGDTQIITLSAGASNRLDKGIENRRSIAVTNTHTTAILYVGFRSTIISTAGVLGGFPVYPKTAISIDCTNRYQIWGIADVELTVGIMEIS